MINAFKQIRLSNGVFISGANGRLQVKDGGALSFKSEVDLVDYNLKSLSGIYDLRIGMVESGLDYTNENVSLLISNSNYLLSGYGGLYQKVESDVSNINENVSNLESGLALAFDNIFDIRTGVEYELFNVTQAVGNAQLELVGISGAINDISGTLNEVSGAIDSINSNVAATQENLSNVANSVNYLSSGFENTNNTLAIATGKIELLETGVSTALNTLISHQSELSGIQSSIYNLYQAQGALNRQSFSYPIPLETEDLSEVLFPSGAFSSVPIVNVTLQSEVGYMFAIKNKTVSGFGISFSDSIQENDVYIDVIATI